MYAIADQVRQWLDAGADVTVAQVVATRGFSSRDPAAAAAWAADASVGSVLEGIDTEKPGHVKARSGHQTPVPRVVGKIRRTRAVEVRDMQFLRANTDRVAKITLPGPFTMSQQAVNEFYGDEEEMVMDYAIAVNAGDAMLILSELALLRAPTHGVDPAVALLQVRIINQTCLALCEGQHLAAKASCDRSGI